uniref:DAB adaptor protein 2 n=1 Tax=Paramormyrops kingsleyae TaxID=1676925 RepID=A0A3B3SGI0_9TELE|nr:disabled homolog 2-like isoform X1 [Paramormyrops kingsleyae]
MSTEAETNMNNQPDQAIPPKTTPKKERKKVPEKTDEFLLSRFKGDGVRYKAKLIGVDDVPGARGDKMSQDSMMKLKGMSAASRSQGKHKQKVWINISLSGIRIIDEKTGVIEYEHAVNKISFIARDVTDNRAFGYVCGAEGQHQFFAVKTVQQADPLVVDLKDLFQLVFNMRRKETEGTDKCDEQINLFGHTLSPPDLQSSSETKDILLLDLSTDIDNNQNCVKGECLAASFVPQIMPESNPSLEKPCPPQVSFFPTTLPDPFSDDPFPKNKDHPAQPNLVAPPMVFNHRQVSLDQFCSSPNVNGHHNGDSDCLTQQFDELSVRTVTQTSSDSQWPVQCRVTEEIPVKLQRALQYRSMQNPFLEVSDKNLPLLNVVKKESGGTTEPPCHPAMDSVIISPPPLNTKAGRGRKCIKSSTNNPFGTDQYASSSHRESGPPQPDIQTKPVANFSGDPVNSNTTMLSLGTLSLGAPAPNLGAAQWGQAAPSIFLVPDGTSQSTSYPQFSVFGASPAPVWGQAPPAFGIAAPPQLPAWGHTAAMAPPAGWFQDSHMSNPFRADMLPKGTHLSSSPTPEPPSQSTPSKGISMVENDAFAALDPLEQEQKNGKDMFKDFRKVKPLQVSAQRGSPCPSPAASAPLVKPPAQPVTTAFCSNPFA